MTKYRYFEIMCGLRNKATQKDYLWNLIKKGKISLAEFKEIVEIKEEKK